MEILVNRKGGKTSGQENQLIDSKKTELTDSFFIELVLQLFRHIEFKTNNFIYGLRLREQYVTRFQLVILAKCLVPSIDGWYCSLVNNNTQQLLEHYICEYLNVSLIFSVAKYWAHFLVNHHNTLQITQDVHTGHCINSNRKSIDNHMMKYVKFVPRFTSKSISKDKLKNNC